MPDDLTARLFAAAVDDRLIATSPCRSITRTVSTMSRSCRLTVDDADFVRRAVRVECQRQQDGVVSATKTARSVRTVPLAQIVIDEPAAHVTPGERGPLFTTERASR